MNDRSNRIRFNIDREETGFILDSDDICNDDNRAIDNRNDSSKNSEKNNQENCKYNDNLDEIKINIFRYKFTESFMNDLYVFSKVHQYDNRGDFKEAWNIWTEENIEIISKEVKRLEELCYQGDILDKMFKSARYYFRKKSTEKKAPRERCEYVGVNRELLNKIDEHIKINISNDDYKPSDAFDSFCKENMDLLKEEIKRLYNIGINNHIIIKNKIKKTYKNRYFIIINK